MGNGPRLQEEQGMSDPQDLAFSKEHEWVRREGTKVTIGITDYAQNELGDVVFVEATASGENIEVGAPIASLESVKAVSDVYSPVSGVLIDSNQALLESPELVNDDPYGEGWIATLELSDPGQLDTLMSAQDYEAFVAEESH